MASRHGQANGSSSMIVWPPMSTAPACVLCPAARMIAVKTSMGA
jgi:hypothetical protein